MKILIVGGTGLIGAHTALLLRQKGHEVTLASRKPVIAASPMASFPALIGDYLADDFSRDTLARFDALIFAAGSDPRHIRAGVDEEEHWRRTNVEGVPHFFARARDAGIRRAINIGSFYPQAAPATIQKSAYVRSRYQVDQAVRALNREGFEVVTLNPPFIVGMTPGDPRPKPFVYVRYALGLISKTPVFAIPGGVNYMSVRSLAEAIAGALERGEPGKAYLIGDENLSFRDYLGLYFGALGRDGLPEIRDEANPLMPPSIGGPGSFLFFETDGTDVARLGYRRSDIKAAVTEIVAAYHAYAAEANSASAAS